MDTDFEQKLDRYAKLVVRIGLNLQPGQRLMIGAPVFDSLTPLEAAPLVRQITEQAYRAGALLVDVIWGDQALDRVRLENAPPESLSEASDWALQAVLGYLQRGDALLLIYAHDPDLLNDQNPEAVAALQKTLAQKAEPIMSYLARNAVNWSVISAAVPGWSAKLFQDLDEEEQVRNTWEILFDICRVNQADPVSAWNEHLRQLRTRSRNLNDKNYEALRLTGGGTDLRVGLPDGHVWISGQMTNQQGIPFVANLPTEEVFSMPHKDRVDGTVITTKPLNYGGSLIEGIQLTFKEGRVVDARADQGEEILRSLLDTDAGASRLGEVALVPHSSPISQTGRLFYNILIDENASNHLALGHAYKFSLKGGSKMDDETFAQAGGNLSAVHLDFMVGSEQMDVDGITRAGAAEPVMRKGEWAFPA